MPERLECEVLQKARYINTLTFTFTFTFKLAVYWFFRPAYENHGLNSANPGFFGRRRLYIFSAEYISASSVTRHVSTTDNDCKQEVRARGGSVSPLLISIRYRYLYPKVSAISILISTSFTEALFAHISLSPTYQWCQCYFMTSVSVYHIAK